MAMKNVLLVTIDSLRDDFRKTDASTIATMAEQGASFQHAFATGPGTTPSFPGILTGTYPLSYSGLGKISEERPFLAKELRSNGLETAGFHSNPFLSESFNYDIGFETFEDYQDSLMGVVTKIFPQGIEKSVIPGPFTSVLKKSYEFIRGKPRPYEQAEIITDDAIEWLKNTSSSFFEWVHYMDVHHPCSPPDSYLREFGIANKSNGEISELYSRAIEAPESVTEEKHQILVDSYRASIRYVDDQIQRLLNHLKQSGDLDETLVIVTSDHGQLFGDLNYYGKPYRLVDPLIKVPLIIKNGPYSFEESTDELVSLVDLPPMIYDALNLSALGSYEGRSLASNPRELILAEHQVNDGILIGGRSMQEKYVVDTIHETERAFHIDSTGKTEVAPARISESLRDRVTRRLNEVEVDHADYISEIDSTTEKRLEDLGYL
jgi:arylsulfatase A-like enzyme